MSNITEETEKKGMDTILFLIFTAILIFMIIFVNEWFWLALPFSLVYLVRSLDTI